MSTSHSYTGDGFIVQYRQRMFIAKVTTYHAILGWDVKMSSDRPLIYVSVKVAGFYVFSLPMIICHPLFFMECYFQVQKVRINVCQTILSSH